MRQKRLRQTHPPTREGSEDGRRPTQLTPAGPIGRGPATIPSRGRCLFMFRSGPCLRVVDRPYGLDVDQCPVRARRHARARQEPVCRHLRQPPELSCISYWIYYSMIAIRTLRQASGLTQAALAQAGGTSQPTIAAYEAGRKSPTLATVDRLARGAGLEATVVFHPPMTREDRRSLALHQAIARRLERDPAAVLERARQTLARMQAVVSGYSQFIREWSILLDRPLTALLEVLTDPSPWARELRHVTPFAGVLSTGERVEAFRVFAEAEQKGRHL